MDNELETETEVVRRLKLILDNEIQEISTLKRNVSRTLQEYVSLKRNHEVSSVLQNEANKLISGKYGMLIAISWRSSAFFMALNPICD